MDLFSYMLFVIVIHNISKNYTLFWAAASLIFICMQILISNYQR